jgi:hypothetical protein
LQRAGEVEFSAATFVRVPEELHRPDGSAEGVGAYLEQLILYLCRVRARESFDVSFEVEVGPAGRD